MTAPSQTSQTFVFLCAAPHATNPAPTNTSSSLIKHGLMRKYCYNEPELQPGMRIKSYAGIAGKSERMYNRSWKEEQGQEQLQWLTGAPWWGKGFQILRNSGDLLGRTCCGVGKVWFMALRTVMAIKNEQVNVFSEVQ